MSTISRPMFLALAAIAAVAVLAAGCGGGEPAAAVAARAPDPVAPSATASEPKAAEAPRPADTPQPARPAVEPPAPVAAPATSTAAMGRVQPRPRPTMPRLDLHHSQVVTAPGQMRNNMAPWRDGGGNRLFSTHVFGTPFMLNEKGEPVPWIATGITSNDDMTVWTMKLREDAVFQDGTPITAADFKAYWEHGAKPENVIAWDGASLSLGWIAGWEELMNGDVAEAEGLRVVDDHTLEIETAVPMPAWPLYMAAWHLGISKLEQVKADENWGNAPIGAGPFSLTYAPETGLTELTRTDLVGGHWNGPHDTPIIQKLVLSNIEDEQARLIMFENGELDVMRIDIETYKKAYDWLLGIDAETHEAELDPNHPLLHVSPYAGLHYIHMHFEYDPLKDLRVRQALAYGHDMKRIVSAIWGPTAIHANGLIMSGMPCHDRNADHQPYDPDLARQQLSDSTYGSGADLPAADDRSAPSRHGRDGRCHEGVLGRTPGRRAGRPEARERRRQARRALARVATVSDVSNRLDSMDPRSDPDRQRIGHQNRDDYQLPTCSLRPPDPPRLIEHARSLPMDDPDRCLAFQAVQGEYLDKIYIIPIREAAGGRWLVQPWLRGFKSTFNQDFNTLTTAYVARH